MKATDLMVGDWVYNHRNWECPILSIRRDYDSEQYYAMVIARHYGEEEFKVEDLSPIPLTAEILEKNGFVNDFYEIESMADYVNVRLEGYSLECKANGWDDALVTWCNRHLRVVTDFNGEVIKDIDFVHELQRALKMCNIDKTIIL